MYHDGREAEWLCGACIAGRIADRGDGPRLTKPDLDVKCAVCGKSATRFRCEEHVTSTEAVVNDDGNVEVDGIEFVFVE